MQRCNVLHIRSTGELLGAERVILELCSLLPAHNFHSIIAIPIEQGQPEPELAEAARKMGYEVAFIPIKGAFDLSALRQVRSLVAKHKISIIHTHGYREDFYTLASLSLVKLLATNHLWKKTNWKLRLYARLDSLLLKLFDHVVAVSKPVRADMINYGLSEKRISVVPNGIDVSRYGAATNRQAIRAEFGFSKESIVLGTLSSLTVEKGIEYAIRSLPKILTMFPNVKLLVVGDGELRSNLETLAATLAVDKNIVFAGRRNDIPSVLSSMDIFLLPSLSEGLPMALLEAMASRLPVVATAVGDVPDVVDENVGALIMPASEEQISSSILQLLDDENGRKQKGGSAAARIAEAFSSEAMARGYADKYRKMLEGKPHK